MLEEHHHVPIVGTPGRRHGHLARHTDTTSGKKARAAELVATNAAHPDRPPANPAHRLRDHNTHGRMVTER